ncbi:tetratricopeptide repeat protein [Reichenbachiella sp.]
MKKLLLLLYLTFNYNFFQAQSVDYMMVDSVNFLLDRSISLVYKDPKLSYELVSSALLMAKTLELKREQSTAYNVLGNLANATGDYIRALDYFLKYYKLANAMQIPREMSKASNGLGLVYKNIGDYEKSLSQYKKALELNVPYDTVLASKYYNNIGVVYKNMDQYDSAQYFFGLSLELKKILGDQRSVANTITNIGNILALKDDSRSAIELFKQALALETEAGLNEGIAKSYNNMSLAYLNLKEIDSAIIFASKGLAISREINTKLQMKEAAEVLSKAYAARGKFEQAYHYQELSYQMKDSLTNEEMARSVGRYEARLELEMKENENRMLRNENQIKDLELIQSRQRFFLILSLTLLLLAGLIFLLVFFRLRRKLLVAEIDELRAKINSNLVLAGVTLDVSLEVFNNKVHNALTEREYEILKLAISQKPNSQIAKEVFVSVNTVKFHLKNIFNKLGVANRVEALELVAQKHS